MINFQSSSFHSFIRGGYLTNQQKVANSLVMVLYVLFAVVFYLLTQRRSGSDDSFERLE
jgi:hypothetical protein